MVGIFNNNVTSCSVIVLAGISTIVSLDVLAYARLTFEGRSALLIAGELDASRLQ